jgi:transcriptional regulator with XRE-family HTH domain
VARPDPDSFVRQVSRGIAEARRSAGLTQAEAAERFGCALRGWQRIEAGLNITLHTAARIATALDLDPWELLRPAASQPEGVTDRPDDMIERLDRFADDWWVDNRAQAGDRVEVTIESTWLRLA